VTYVDDVRDALLYELPGINHQLLDMCALLVYVKGQHVTHADFHHGWALWTRRSEPSHMYMLPPDQLPPEVEEMDKQYLEAIRSVAVRVLGAPNDCPTSNSPDGKA
jgi:hypothetical protein